MKRNFLIIFCALQLQFFSSAQTAAGTAGVKPQQQMIASCSLPKTFGDTCTQDSSYFSSVLLKFFSEDVIFKNGVYLYRTHLASNNRVQLNEKPLKTGTFPLSESEFQRDTTLKQYKILLDKNSSEIKDLLAVFVLLKAFESNDFARYAGLFFEDSTAVKGEQYYYEFSELSTAAGQVPGNGISNLVTAGEYKIGAAPDSLNAEAHDSRVVLRWQPDEYRYWGVYVERADSNASMAAAKAESTTSAEYTRLNNRPILISPLEKQDGSIGYPDKFYEDKTVQNGKTYLYRIVGVDYFNRETSYSNPVIAQPRDETAPAPPQNLRSEIGLFDITLTWENAFVSKDFAGYNVYRKKGRGEYKKLTSALLSENIFFDTVKESGTYTYIVSSVDSSGNEARSFETTKELIDIFPPAIPVLKEVLSDTGKIHLAWTQAHESDLLGYRIYRTVTNDKNSHYVLISSTPVKDTFFTDKLPRNAKNKFCYKVVSVDSLFNMSEYSNVECVAMPDVEPPEIPVIKHIVADSGFPLITWLANVDEDLHFYRLQRHCESDTAVFSIDIVSTQNNFRDTTAQSGVAYSYVLSACDKSNNMSQTSKPYIFRLVNRKK